MSYHTGSAATSQLCDVTFDPVLVLQSVSIDDTHTRLISCGHCQKGNICIHITAQMEVCRVSSWSSPPPLSQAWAPHRGTFTSVLSYQIKVWFLLFWQYFTLSLSKLCENTIQIGTFLLSKSTLFYDVCSVSSRCQSSVNFVDENYDEKYLSTTHFSMTTMRRDELKRDLWL